MSNLILDKFTFENLYYSTFPEARLLGIKIGVPPAVPDSPLTPFASLD